MTGPLFLLHAPLFLKFDQFPLQQTKITSLNHNKDLLTILKLKFNEEQVKSDNS